MYRQQQEQVKQTMMVTTKSTKMVRPTATVAPNPDVGSLSMSELYFHDSASFSCALSKSSLILAKLFSKSRHLSWLHTNFFSTSEQQYWL